MSDSGTATPPRGARPPPGATGPQIRRRAAALTPKKEVESLRSAGQGGSSSTMMRLYTQDENPGLKVDPVIVLSLAVVFVFSVVSLHLLTRVAKWFSK
ncbi:beta subunit of the sec61p er translocation complex (sec61p-sss1p-sbh1p) [Pseudohyphozyma bogoriensis]|nr:beta subunit of the sec61p er translocation complex (sec61p-sss1p-sbh1p) [Pseudohyphozyma bogoriensis]